jgi:hypothetical protein
MPIRRQWVTCLSTALLFVSVSAAAQRPDSSESAIKAAFLYNFTKFVDWPDSAFAQPSTPFVVCAFADATFRGELEGILRNEQVRGRPITIGPASAEDARGCHMAYFGQPDDERQGRMLEAVKRAPVLTVGEGLRFLDQGGVIAFVLENNRVRFSVSKRNADAAGLGISSRLLRVARDFAARAEP